MDFNNDHEKVDRMNIDDFGENPVDPGISDAADRSEGRRIPIKKRVRFASFFVVILTVIAVMALSFAVMLSIRDKTEATLTEQLIRNMRNKVHEKAEDTEIRLRHYEEMITFVTDYINEMYEGREDVIKIGRPIDPPLSTTPEGEFALQCSYSDEALFNDPRTQVDMYFFSGLEKIYSPMTRENADLIVTAYTVTNNGFMVAYDRDSYLAANQDDSMIIYDYFDSEWYQKGSEADGVVYTGLYEDVYGRGLVITLASPFNDEKGDFRGVTCIDFNIHELYDKMISVDLEEASRYFAIDMDGHIITPESIGLSVEDYTGLSREEADSLCEGVEGILETEDAFYVYTPIKNLNWILCACVPKEEILMNVRSIDRTISSSLILLFAAVLVIMIIVVIVTNKLVESMTDPMNQLSKDMDIISSGDLEHKAVRIRDDEIGDVAVNLNKMVDRLRSTITDLDDAQKKVSTMSDNVIKDSLTGIRNKTAYEQVLISLEDDFKKGLKEFGFAKINLNGLKDINDSFGYDKGDEAIKKLCFIVCHVFEHSPVFRIGGDEFIAILKGKDYANIEALCLEFHGEFVSMTEDDSLQPWEKISAAIGYALYDELDDRSIDDVVKRADSDMYECKRHMKSGKK